MKYINFSYCYRDAGNNKKHSAISFINTDEISLNDMNDLIRSRLIDGIWFVPKEWDVPDLHFECWDRDLDYNWHEFLGLECSDRMLGSDFNLTDFIKLLKRTSAPASITCGYASDNYRKCSHS